MRHTLTALVSAASICAFAGVAPAGAQAFYGAPGPYATPAPGPYTHYPEGGLVKGDSVVPPQISYSLPPSEQVAQPGVVGSCSIIAGNRVCTDTPAYNPPQYGYGYGYGAPGGFLGAAVGAPVAAAGALAAAPFEAAGALTGAPYAPAPGLYAPGPYAAAPMGYGPAPVGYAPVRHYPAGGPVKGQSVVPSQTAYSLPPSEQTARPGVVGSCSIIAGNRVCSAAPAIP